MSASPSFAIPIATRGHLTGAMHAPRLREDFCTADIPLAHGGMLAGARIAWSLCGPEGAPVVCVLGGISAGRRVAVAPDGPGWWSEIVAPGAAIDTGRVRVLSIDYLGGNGESTGPRTGTAIRPVDTRDQARAVAAVLDRLRIPRLAAFVGSSYGGMVALAFAEEFPSRVERVVAISAAHAPHPQATALRSIQRRVVELGGDNCAEALAVARGLAMVTYRSPREFEQRFAGVPSVEAGRFRFPVEDYLESRGREFAARFDAAAFLALSESIDLHRVDPSAIAARTTLVAVESDQLVPVEWLRRLSRAIAGPCELAVIDSLYGHDAFLKERAAITDILRTALEAR